MIISDGIQSSELVQQKSWVAPKGKLYRITDVHISILQSGGLTNFFLVDYLLEERGDPSSPREWFVAINTNIAGLNIDYAFNIPVVTKFISVVRDATGAFNLLLVINYELIRASRTELLIEWFRKGR